MRLPDVCQAKFANHAGNLQELCLHVCRERVDFRLNGLVQHFYRPTHALFYLKFEIIERARAMRLPSRAADGHFIQLDGRHAYADGHALSVLAAGAYAFVQL
jgi:hypothetical protein